MRARERILDAAGERFASDGLLGSRLEDIRLDADVSVGAIYHHFPDKATLHAEAWLSVIANYQDAFVEVLARSDTAEAGVRGVVQGHLRWVKSHRGSATLLETTRPERASRQLGLRNRAFYERVHGWWRLHSSYGSLRELDDLVLHALWLGPAQDYCRHWLAAGQRSIPRSVGEQLADAAWLTLKGERA